MPQSDEPPHARDARAYACLQDIRIPLDILVQTRSEFDRFVRVPASLANLVASKGEVVYG